MLFLGYGAEGQTFASHTSRTSGLPYWIISLPTNEPLLHGEAVSIGMVIESKLSEKKGYLDAKEVFYIEDTLSKMGLPVRMPDLKIKDILKLLQSDKKNEGGMVKYSLLKKMGTATYNEKIDERIVIRVLEESLAKMNSQQ